MIHAVTMGPKTVAVTKELCKTTRDGQSVKFIYVVIGSKSDPIKLTVNCNCRMDILLDSVRIKLSKLIHDKIQHIKAAAAANTEPTSDSDATGAAINKNSDSMISDLTKLYATLSDTSLTVDLLDLQDSDSAFINSKEHLDKDCSSIVSYFSTYSLCAFSTEQQNYCSLLT